MARRSKWDYKPESWKHMSKRNDYGCMVIIMMFCCLIGITSCCISCSKEDEGYDSTNSEKVDEPRNTIDKIAGVWEALDNDLFFISISPQGKVSYCFSRCTMGIGHGILKEKELVVENDYSGYSDKLDVNIVNGTMFIKGAIRKKGTNENEDIMLSLRKVDEENVYSFVGKFWSERFLSAIYGWGTETLSFVGDNVAQYRKYVNKDMKILSEDVWYYIPRKHRTRREIVYFNTSKSTTPTIGVRNSSFSYYQL